MKNIIQTLAGFALGAILLYLSLKGTDLVSITETILGASLSFTLLSCFGMLSVFMLRAARWKLLLEETGARPAYWSVFVSLGIGYFVNSFTPKLGEIARCTSLKQNSGTGLATSAGALVTERVYDILILFGGLFTISALEIDRLRIIFQSIANNFAHKSSSILIWPFIILIFIVAGIIISYRKQLANISLLRKVANFLVEVTKAARLSILMKKYRMFVIYTISIWSILILINYFFLQALNCTSNESWLFAVVVLFISTIGWALPSPGGIGTTHFLILQLFLLYNLPEDSGLAFGIYSNGLTFVFTIISGLFSLAGHYFIVQNKRRKSVAALRN